LEAVIVGKVTEFEHLKVLANIRKEGKAMKTARVLDPELLGNEYSRPMTKEQLIKNIRAKNSSTKFGSTMYISPERQAENAKIIQSMIKGSK
jgi:hypothetical protein